MGEKKYYWLKLKDDFFKQKEMKKLRKIAGGDTYTIIYLKMMLLSIKNEGKVCFTGLEETFAEELALDIDEEATNIEVVLRFLEKYKMIEQGESDEYFLPEAIKAIGSETASAARVRKLRSNVKALQCNGDVTKCNTEIEIEKDIDKEEDKEKKKRNIVDFKKHISEYTSNEDLILVLNDFLSMRKSIKKPLSTERALNMLLEKLNNLSNNNDEIKIKLLEQSIFKNWLDVFPLTEQAKQKQEQPKRQLSEWEENQRFLKEIAKGQ